MQIETFISKFSQWAYKGAVPKRDASKFPTVLRQAIFDELPKRDSFLGLITRNFENTQNLRLRLVSDNGCCKHSESGGLEISVFSPSWRNDFRNYSSSEYISDQLSDFFHFAEQYVARGMQVNFVGAIAMTYNQYCSFKGNILEWTQIPNDSSFIKTFKNSFLQQRTLNTNEKTILYLSNTLNCLDPYINRMVYYYVKALELDSNEFYEDATTSLDIVIKIAEQFIKDRLCVHIGDKEEEQRESISRYLNLGKSTQDILKFLYELRCFFGAHPAFSKWWDFGEIYETDIRDLFDATKYVLIKIAELECQNRIIEKYPAAWSDWFHKNAMTVWNSVWFDRIPKKWDVYTI